jgi:hypothetical protein
MAIKWNFNDIADENDVKANWKAFNIGSTNNKQQ